MRWSSRLPADSNGGDLPPALPALRRIGLNNFECEYVANPNMFFGHVVTPNQTLGDRNGLNLKSTMWRPPLRT
jgi:hypothetical protein